MYMNICRTYIYGVLLKVYKKFYLQICKCRIALSEEQILKLRHLRSIYSALKLLAAVFHTLKS